MTCFFQWWSRECVRHTAVGLEMVLSISLSATMTIGRQGSPLACNGHDGHFHDAWLRLLPLNLLQIDINYNKYYKYSPLSSSRKKEGYGHTCLAAWFLRWVFVDCCVSVIAKKGCRIPHVIQPCNVWMVVGPNTHYYCAYVITLFRLVESTSWWTQGMDFSDGSNPDDDKARQRTCPWCGWPGGCAAVIPWRRSAWTRHFLFWCWGVWLRLIVACANAQADHYCARR